MSIQLLESVLQASLLAFPQLSSRGPCLMWKYGGWLDVFVLHLVFLPYSFSLPDDVWESRCMCTKRFSFSEALRVFVLLKPLKVHVCAICVWLGLISWSFLTCKSSEGGNTVDPTFPVENISRTAWWIPPWTLKMESMLCRHIKLLVWLLSHEPQTGCRIKRKPNIFYKK